MSRYLVTGAGGQLGNCFKSVASEFSQHQLFFANRSEIDLNQPSSLAAYFERQSFEGILNCAAYTQVDQAEKEREGAQKINGIGVQKLVDFATVNGLKLIHFSTDFIFDGSNEKAYLETDTPNPINAYGESKYAGEVILSRAPCAHVTFRISWLFSPFGNNFVKTIRSISRSKAEINVVNDQIGKPTYGIDLARTVLGLLDHPDLFNFSLYHFAQGPATNWFEFAQRIVELSGETCLVNPIPSKEYPTPAKRPLRSVLDTSRIEKIVPLPIRNWELGLRDCIEQIRSHETI